MSGASRSAAPNLDRLSEKQATIVDRLVAAGWSIDFVDTDTVFLSKRKNRFTSFYQQIDRDGNGYEPNLGR